MIKTNYDKIYVALNKVHDYIFYERHYFILMKYGTKCMKNS